MSQESISGSHEQSASVEHVMGGWKYPPQKSPDDAWYELKEDERAVILDNYIAGVEEKAAEFKTRVADIKDRRDRYALNSLMGFVLTKKNTIDLSPDAFRQNGEGDFFRRLQSQVKNKLSEQHMSSSFNPDGTVNPATYPESIEKIFNEISDPALFDEVVRLVKLNIISGVTTTALFLLKETPDVRRQKLGLPSITG